MIVGTPVPVRTVKLVAAPAVPPGVVTETNPLVAPLGTVAVIWVSELTVKAAAVPLNDWLRQGLRYAPLAAMAAVVVPEIVMQQGHLIHTWQDARLFAAAAGAAWFWWRRGILGTIVVGMVVLLPLRLGLGW